MKTKIFLFLYLLLSFAAIAQTKTTKDISKKKNYQTLTERISGQWKLDRIVDAENNLNSQQGQKNEENKGPKNPNDASEVNSNQSNNAMQIIEFMDDARYKMNNSTTALDSGNYTLNEQNQSLVMQSDIASSQPAEWNITLKNNKLTLVGRDAASKRYQYVYSRMKEKELK